MDAPPGPSSSNVEEPSFDLDAMSTPSSSQGTQDVVWAGGGAGNAEICLSIRDQVPQVAGQLTDQEHLRHVPEDSVGGVLGGPSVGEAKTNLWDLPASEGILFASQRLEKLQIEQSLRAGIQSQPWPMMTHSINSTEDYIRQLTANPGISSALHNEALRNCLQATRNLPQEDMNFIVRNVINANSLLNFSQSSVQPNTEVALPQRNPSSGPRRGTEGVSDQAQGIAGARCLADGSLMLHMTLLVAGFIIGPSGVTIRSIMKKTGATILSWTENCISEDGRKFRAFVIKGSSEEITNVVRIICLAVCRYKELAEGKCIGQRVSSTQVVEGVEFTYRPPPKNKAPQAAAIDAMTARHPLHTERLRASKKLGNRSSQLTAEESGDTHSEAQEQSSE